LFYSRSDYEEAESRLDTKDGERGKEKEKIKKGRKEGRERIKKKE